MTSALLVIAAAAALASCGESGGAADGSDQPALVATTTIWADVVSNVACGEQVTAVIPAGSDPHAFEPSLQDRELLAAADVVVANGGGLEESLADLLTETADEGGRIVEITEQLEPLIEDDPHVWQDPVRVAGTLDAIAGALVAAGRDADEIRACTDRYRSELQALDAEIDDRLSAIPADRRVLVTNHDAFGYFADRYGLDVVGTVIPSSSTLGESSAGQLAELADVIEELGVPAIFSERLGSAHDAEALGDRLGVEVVELDSDALEDDGPGSTYVGMMRSNAEAIAAALAPA